MTTTRVTRTGESPDAKSKRMAAAVPARIAETRAASEAIYGIVKPADEQPRRKAAIAKAKAAKAADKP